MEKIKIYRFKKYDIISDNNITSRRMATKEAIEKICAELLPETAIEVNLDIVDDDGMTIIDFTHNP